jgi:hypothetical protein
MYVSVITFLAALAVAAGAQTPGAATPVPPLTDPIPSGLLAALRQRYPSCINGVPAPPQSIVVVPGDGFLVAAWAPPANRPCSLSYTVTATAPGLKPIVTEVTQLYVTLSGLQNGKEYAVSVVARSPSGKSAAATAAGIPRGKSGAAVAAGTTGGTWACRAVAEPPSCPAAASKLCRAMTCEEVAARGLCAASFVRHTIWTAATVEQRCVAECGCAAAPSLRQSMALPAADACCAIATAEYWQDEQGRTTAGLEL